MANVKCPKCGNLITNVSAGQTVKCTQCGHVMKLSSPSNSDTKQSNAQTQMPTRKASNKGGSGVKVIGIILIVIGVLGILMGMMMFGDIGIACIVGALSALLSGIGFVKVSKEI